MAYKLQVDNLSDTTPDIDLRALFAQAVTVSAASVIKDHTTHASTGYAFVRMTTRVDTPKALSLFNTYRLGERSLTVSLVKPRHVRSSGQPRRFQP